MLLENKYVSYEFCDRCGSLIQIENKTTGKKYFNYNKENAEINTWKKLTPEQYECDSSIHRLVKLIVPTEDHIGKPIYSHHAGEPVFSKKENTLNISFPELIYKGEKTDIFINVDVTLEPDSKEAIFKLHIDNKSNYMIYEVWFPYIGGRYTKWEEGKDIITTSLDQRNIYKELYDKARSTHTFGNHHNRINIGPEFMLPIMDMSDGKEGLSYIKYQKEPSPCILMFENPLYTRDKICLTWSWCSQIFQEPKTAFDLAPCGVGVHEGDWHSTCDRFRNWLKTWWTPCDTPKELKEKTALFHTTTHGFSGEPIFEFKDLPAIAEDCQKFGINDIIFWDYTTSIYLRPDKGDFWEMPKERELEFKTAAQKCKEMGVNLSAFINFRLLVKYNSTYADRTKLSQIGLFDAPNYGFGPCSMDGGRYQEPGMEMGSEAICYGSDEFLEYAQKIIDKTFEMGCDVFALDQGAEWCFCLAKNHGHKSPWEAWQRSYDWFGNITEQVRKRNPNAYTVSEVPDLYNLNKLDMWWDWGWRDGESGNLRLFKYIFQNFIGVWGVDENQYEIIGEAFCLGAMLAVATKGMQGKISDVPFLAEKIKSLSVLKKEISEYMLNAEFMDTQSVQGKNCKAYLYKGDNYYLLGLANSQAEETEARVICDFDTENYCATFFTENREPVSIKDFSVKLPPYGAGFILLTEK